jgi:hypothetical protein
MQKKLLANSPYSNINKANAFDETFWKRISSKEY